MDIRLLILLFFLIRTYLKWFKMLILIFFFFFWVINHHPFYTHVYLYIHLWSVWLMQMLIPGVKVVKVTSSVCLPHAHASSVIFLQTPITPQSTLMNMQERSHERWPHNFELGSLLNKYLHIHKYFSTDLELDVAFWSDSKKTYYTKQMREHQHGRNE